MGRKKIIPDDQVFTATQALLARGGDKAVSFFSVGRETGLAPATLVQRFGSREAMVKASLMAGWVGLEALLGALASQSEPGAKGAAQILKGLDTDLRVLLMASQRDADLHEQAEAWRGHLTSILAAHLGGGTKGAEAGAMLFALWLGQALWGAEAGFRLKDAIKRLT